VSTRPFVNDTREWLEADGLGGFASGTVSGVRTRRYHALLLAATTPPPGRVVLVNGLDAWVETSGGTRALTSQRYAPDVTHPDGAARIESFETAPWPTWRFALEDGTRVEQEFVAMRGAPIVAMTWRLVERGAGDGGTPGPVILRARPFLSGRDYHSMQHENPAFRFDPKIEMVGGAGDRRLTWHPYDGVPGVVALTNGAYAHDPVWYRNFLYEEERVRGLDATEDLAAPGVFKWDLARGEAITVFAIESDLTAPLLRETPSALLASLRARERARRGAFRSRLHRAADDYVVRRGDGWTIAAGYPWFTDWGRDRFIALRGLCIAGGRLDDAKEILLEWAGAVSEGMLPNRFPDRGDTPEFNSVDASLWYIVAVHELLGALEAERRVLPSTDRARLATAVAAILAGYARGTRFGIRADEDGLLAAGEPGWQLTWMDAKVGDQVITPRIGKPVEIEALWLNALWIGERLVGGWGPLFDRASESFRKRFWHERGGYLHDVVDVDHHAGTVDPSFRPNQIFAVGGLPLMLLDAERARRVVDSVEARLWTPLGPRSLAPGEPGYRPRYEGDVWSRDSAYHQGTVWPWLAGAFVEAWVRVRGGTPEAKREARARFLEPLLAHLDDAGLGHISEIADAEPPHTPRGCPFQAWSVGEALRLSESVLAAAASRSIVTNA